ncbi:hypothetical protein A4E84_15165 [Streptomyces qaidamensis]|uniref:Uncharacterized protein n=1 Tax=Streptomyces qaidamensis TaxID=1783515 RepID=A0A143BZV3_9ACTN|nr:hypothetical protein A4E84_15165 [Streptomyces qaidamensis]
MYEIRIAGHPSTEEALALQDPIKRLLCPDPDHAPPCEVPWSFTVADDGPDGGSTALVLGVYASEGEATRVAAQVRNLAGAGRAVAVSEGDAGEWEELVEQYRFERGLHSERSGPGQ